MGGSILGAKSIYFFLKTKVKKEVFFFDNLDANLHLQFNKIKNLKNSCVIIISKSGNTLETITNLDIIFSKSLLKNKLIFITEMKDSSLMSVAEKYNAEIIEYRDFIVGRYSILSEVGMVPAALMGLDIKKFGNLKKLIHNKYFVSSLIRNVASIYTFYKRNIKNSVILNYDSDLNDLCYWYQQLVAESLGKKSKGILPIVSQMPKDNHSVMQFYLDGPKNNFFTFFDVFNQKSEKIDKSNLLKSHSYLKNKSINEIILAQRLATEKIFKKKKIPFRSFFVKKKNEQTLGELFCFFILETILLGRALKVNPFDQPSVELIKKETKKILI